MIDSYGIERHCYPRSDSEAVWKLNHITVIELWLIPGSYILRVEGSAGNVGAARRVSYPGHSGGVKDGICPGIYMDGEAHLADVSGISLDEPIGRVAHVQFVKPYHDARRCCIRPGKRNVPGSGGLMLGPGVIFLGVELPPLQVVVLGSNSNPVAASRVQDSITPGIDVDLEVLAGHEGRRGPYPNASFPVYIEFRQPQREARSCAERLSKDD